MIDTIIHIDQIFIAQMSVYHTGILDAIMIALTQI